MDAIQHSGAGLVLVATRPGLAEALGCVAGPVQWLPTPRPDQRGGSLSMGDGPERWVQSVHVQTVGMGPLRDHDMNRGGRP
ncbi:hypothetical protein CFAM422_000443 [Trichoderma lentiforme]|uniref:Uncharacterized protein n=1 Tax=Trichoderma lentiforme TaxID=1567552 RepID=A0A9P5CGZ6_9HYPO|nr:hypothetical protein CFAM422_000443 [Trichoderma lentiforme]